MSCVVPLSPICVHRVLFPITYLKLESSNLCNRLRACESCSHISIKVQVRPCSRVPRKDEAVSGIANRFFTSPRYWSRQRSLRHYAVPIKFTWVAAMLRNDCSTARRTRRPRLSALATITLDRGFRVRNLVLSTQPRTTE